MTRGLLLHSTLCPWDLPGGPVAKTVLPVWGPGFNPWSGSQIPQATANNSHTATKDPTCRNDKKEKKNPTCHDEDRRRPVLQLRWSQVKHKHHIPETHGWGFTGLQVAARSHRLDEAPQFLHPHYRRRVFRLSSTSCYYKSVPLASLCTPRSLSRPPCAPGPGRATPAPLTQETAGRGPATCTSHSPQSCGSCWPRALWGPLHHAEFCAVMGTPYICTVSSAATSHRGALTTWKVAGGTRELNLSVL